MADENAWYVKLGHTMFNLCSDKLWLTVQPHMNNIGICDNDDPIEKCENDDEWKKLNNDDAKVVLVLIKEGIEKALDGGELDLMPAMSHLEGSRH